ncbi:MAG TPA: NAD(P)-dependent oxidoreductase [Campylobacterales bacterium]|nr:NAD(P)-dependent oxidoreductase [Campylobacterales bacterium]HIO70639.1 NAD(P)-dependent oxidoreductase [Campylobacterales bacterium]
MKRVAILFGGSGYIGTFLIQRFLERNRFDLIYIGDIQKSSISDSRVIYKYIDVREEIELQLPEIDTKNSWIFNLAAIHREPGHQPCEYFDTNIKGAENINRFAEKYQIQNIFFTSSIAPYGKSLDEVDESSMLYPETPYGISKALAEKIHQNWLACNRDRRLIICRPSVIYGPKDPGNILRMVKAVQKGIFFFPNSGEIVKSHGYIYGLLDSIEFVLDRDEKLIIYNYAEYPIVNLREMTEIIRKLFNINRPVWTMPMWLLVSIAYIIKILKPNSSIHPTRVKKAGFPTNIRPTYLIEKGFKFRYGFEKSLIDWKEREPKDFEK